MTDVVVDTLRLRGTHAQRLARVAARALPAALERALADVDGREIASIRVVLDVDPADHDDETLAILWADRIRAEILAQPRTDRGGSAPRPADLPPVLPSRDVDLVMIARAWLALEVAEATAAVPAALLALGDPAVAGQVASELGAEDWAALVTTLRRAFPTRRTGVDPDVDDEPAGRPLDRPGDATGKPAGEVADTVVGPPPKAADEPSRDEARPDFQEPATEADLRQEDVLAVVQVLRELRAGDPTPLDPAVVTRAAGLVLLYPWLADHCRRAEELHPGLDAYDVREAALAAVLDDASAADDPLVRFLAGRSDPFDPVVRDRFDLPSADEVAESAGRVVASFAALLPGFERSSPAFVRDAWLARLGVLDVGRDPVMLTAATHPLDVLLPLLPYPLGLLKLPWSGLLTVRFRP